MRINLAKDQDMSWQSSARKRAKLRESEVSSVTIDPGGFVRRMVELESRGNGDECNALERVARRIGIGSRVARRIKNGERKTVDVSLFARMRMAYLELCEAQIRKLEHEIATERALHGVDDDLENMADAVLALRQELQAKKGQSR